MTCSRVKLWTSKAFSFFFFFLQSILLQARWERHFVYPGVQPGIFHCQLGAVPRDENGLQAAKRQA
jgi:hypothetical protein